MVREVNTDPQSAAGMVVTVCGGGNAAHVAAAMYAHHGATVNVFLSLEKEAKQWQEAALQTGIEMHKKYEGETYTGRIAAASADAAAVIPEADLIVITVPAFAHRPILTSIGPHLKKGAIVLAMPAPGNFDLLARHVLGAKVDDVVLAGSVCLPWVVRTAEYARRVELLGEKSPVTLVTRPSRAVDDVVAAANRVHDGSRFRGENVFLEATLFPTNPMLHPGIMFSFWSRWDGAPLAVRPLFYGGVDDFTAGILEGEDADLQATKRAVEAALGMSLVLPTLKEQMTEGYGDQISDPSTYRSMLATNSSLNALFHPSKEDKDGKWGPDFASRYLWEDVPYGLCAMKGVSQLLGVPTPTIDRVLTWAQGVMEREYLVGDQLTGKDVGSTAAPQAFGIATREALLSELKHQLEGVAPASALVA